MVCRTLISIVILTFFTLSTSCSSGNSKTETKQEDAFSAPAPQFSIDNDEVGYTEPSISPNPSKVTQEESSTNVKYHYRSRNDQEYQYNYDVSGLDYDGNSVRGNIDINGKYGSGTIEDENGNTKYIDVEWVDYGVMEGVDEDGNYYDLEVD
jgi:uncharacterized protein YcfL